jgi:multidrug efflux system membrane fusion protein
VLVLNDKNEAEKRPVKLGTTFDGLRVVEQGLTTTDRVIVVGKQNVLLRNVVIEPQEVKMQDFAAAGGAKVVPSKESEGPAAK